MTQTPDDRYGRRKRSGDRGLKISFAVFLVLLVSGTVWVGLAHSNPDVRADIPSFRVTSDHSVEVQISVHKDKDRAAVCVLRSRGSDGDEVGRKEVRFPAGEKKLTVTEVLQTTDRPNTAELEDCKAV